MVIFRKIYNFNQMKNISNLSIILTLLIFWVFITGCERDIDGLPEATYPTTAEVYIDGFSSGLNYAAFGGSDVTAFDVDTEVKYKGTSSMRIAVPDFEDPKGAYAGGVYFTETGRDLSSYTALTFWAKASKAANIDILGIGNDLGENTFQASITDVPVNTNWTKYYIPLPDASKLTKERGMFFYSEGPEEERGYTIWIDEVMFENLGTIAHQEASILDGEDVTVQAETGSTYNLNGITTFNLPTGINQNVNTSSAYFTFSSSDESVAVVDETGTVMVINAGSAVITATLNGIPVEGSLHIESSGAPILPLTPAPAPTKDSEDVISIFSDYYTNVNVDFYNGYWQFSTTTSDIIEVDGDDIIRYQNLNFVGIQFTSPTIDVSDMTHLHIDIWTPNPTGLPKTFKVLLFDLGPDGTFDGNDNASHEISFTSPILQTEEWVSLDIPMSDFTGLTSKSHLAQIVLSGDLPTVFVDNIYFYNDGTVTNPTIPTTAAPTPMQDQNDVISVYSDSYENVVNTNLNPNWGQATVFSQLAIQGNNTIQLTGLNYQGIELGSSQDVSEMEYLHIDYWTMNSTLLNIYLISPGPVENNSNLIVPTQGWSSLDIPLSTFGDVDLTDIFQLKFDGNGTIFMDNIYFFKENMNNGTEPNVAAPEPTLMQENVISLFSEVYTNVPVDSWRTDWSAASLEDVTIDNNATKKYSSLDFVGIETTTNQIDASAMTHFHIDVWSSDFTFFAVKLVDFGADGAYGGGDDVEHQIEFDTPAQGQWISYDIPLSDFTGLTTRNHMAQYILVGRPTGASTVYVDNVYFHN